MSRTGGRGTSTGGRRGWDYRRLAGAAILLVWAAFFIYLWAGGDIVRYLGPRTYWVVFFGAVALGGAGIVGVATARVAGGGRPSRSEIGGLAILVAPILATILVPGASLGALAASKKNAGGGIASVSAVVPPAPDTGRPVSFQEIHFAGESQDYARALGIVEGYEVSLTGFVSGEAPGGGFVLTRFYVSCCAADALPYSVAVRPEGGSTYEDDTWLEVTGTLHQDGGGFVLVPDEVSEVAEPDDPYL